MIYTTGDDEGVVLRTMESTSEFESDSYFKELYGDNTERGTGAYLVDLIRITA